METNNQNAFWEQEPLGKLMVRYAVPCVISLLVAALYNIVDQIFIANADYLGSYGNAANTVVFPLTVVALAIAVMIGDGCCAYVSICLGARNQENAHRSIGSSVVLCIAASQRAKRIMEVYSQREEAPEKRLRDKDRRRASYYQFYTDMAWGQADNYHIALDSGVLGIPRCADILAHLF